ncbi:MAG: S8 family serine peptidase [Acidobacteria bacterium]|nr:S8 family serine peptidase [Acidobacteriota bacterium]
MTTGRVAGSALRLDLVLGDIWAPVISGLAAVPPAFSPNSDGVKDDTTIEANLADESPAAWALEVKSEASTVVRSFSGPASPVEATWDGRDSSGAVVADGSYAAVLSATDDWANVQTASPLTLVVDTVGPVFSGWVPADGGNTLWKRPQVSVAVSDPTGVASGSVAMKIDGTGVSASYAGGRAAGSPTWNLSVDADDVADVTATDAVGNTAEGSAGFRVVRVLQEDLLASVPDVTGQVPSLTECLAGCTVTFRDVRVAVGAHGVTLSSTAHPGSGEFRRPVPLTSASVEWRTVAGGEASTPANVPSASWGDVISFDDVYLFAARLPFEPSDALVGDVTVPVPPEAERGSVATLRMPPVNVPPLCYDTSAVPDPGACGGPSGGDPDPVPSPEVPSPLDEDATVPLTYEAVPDDIIVPGLPWPDDDPEKEPHVGPPSGDTSVTEFSPGSITVKVRPGEDIYQVVADHGGSAADVQRAATPPFDSIEVEVGLDRDFYVNVPAGQEKPLVQEYAADARVEDAQLTGVTMPAGSPNDPYANKTNQWNLFGPQGIYMYKAWPFATYGAEPYRPIDGGRGATPVDLAVIDSGIKTAHEDFAGKVKASYDFLGQGSVSETGCAGGHGTAVAGINAQTDNSKGLAGVDYHGGLIVVRVFDGSCGFHGGRTDPIKKAVALGAKVINISYFSTTEDPGECDAIAAAWRKGIVTVVIYAEEQTGNPAGAVSFWPGRCPYALVTTAGDRSGKKYSQAFIDDNVDVAAPGSAVSSVSDDGNAKYDLDGWWGTSLAAPHVAGVGQLLGAMGVPHDVAHNTIRGSSTPMPGECPSPCKGRVNAYRAMRSTLTNGVFELWPQDPDMPFRWNRAGTCGSPHEYRSTANYTYDGRYSLAVQCTGGGYHDIYQNVQVENGWTYSVVVRARVHAAGQPNPDRMRILVSFYDTHGKRIKSYARTGDQDGVGTTWTRWRFATVAPAGAVVARIVLRTYSSTGTGAAYWDDAGFYAVKAP